MYNKVILAGNLTRDIDVKFTNSGLTIANTAIATNRKFKAQNGEQKEEIMFMDITFFGRTAEVAKQYLHRGSKVLIEGRLKFDQWVDQNGGKRSKHSISVESMQMLDSKGNQTENRDSTKDTSYGNNYPPQPEPLSIVEEEMPF